MIIYILPIRLCRDQRLILVLESDTKPGEAMKQLCVTLDEATVETLRGAAEELQIPFSAAVRIAVRQGLNELDKSKVILK